MTHNDPKFNMLCFHKVWYPSYMLISNLKSFFRSFNALLSS